MNGGSLRYQKTWRLKLQFHSILLKLKEILYWNVSRITKIANKNIKKVPHSSLKLCGTLRDLNFYQTSTSQLSSLDL